MVKVGIMGATGYAGANLVSLLSSRTDVSLQWLGSHHSVGLRFSEVFPALLGTCDLVLKDDDLIAASKECDVLFLALPAGIAGKEVNEEMLSRCVVIDLGADFRLHDASAYEQWYHTEAPSASVLAKAVYGLPELHRHVIKESDLIANPGCYTTASILSLAPLMGCVDPHSLIIDAMSGVSGAGRKEKVSSLFCECDESCKAYGVGDHRHTPEIEQELSLAGAVDAVVQFTPHLVPMDRGILATCTADLLPGVTEQEISSLFHKAYDGEACVRIYPSAISVESRFVTRTNTFAVGWTVDGRTGRVIVCGALDNLYKGAAGQAVQNMNIRFGFPETEGLATYSI